MALCLSLRLSELRNGADVLRLLRGFLNIVCYNQTLEQDHDDSASYQEAMCKGCLVTPSHTMAVAIYVIRLRQLHRYHVIVLLMD